MEGAGRRATIETGLETLKLSRLLIGAEVMGIEYTVWRWSGVGRM